ncbi:MAG: eight-cysteine-cluster domain-containing protein [Candidatus Micrarchaeota archaeon]
MAAGIYIAAGALGGTAPPEGGGEGAEAAELFLEAVEKPLGAGDYTYSYREAQSSGYWAEVTASRKGDLSYVYKKDLISERSGYFEGNGTIVCIKYMDEEKCAPVNGTSRFVGYASSLRALLFDDDAVRAQDERYRKLMQYGGMEFDAGTEEKTVGGHACTEVGYRIDYSRLTVAQLNEIGMDVNDPLLLRSRQYNYSMCIDPVTYDMLEKRVEFTDMGEPVWLETRTLDWSWGSGLDVQKPSAFVDESELVDFYTGISRVAESYIACLAGNETERCIAEAAIIWENPALCSEAGSEKDFCLINAGLGAGDPSVCNDVGAEMKDACYLEFANSLQDSSFCGRILDAALRQQCDALNISAGCTVDSDCARAGCSSQLCVAASEAPGIVTTCEYRPEYACYAQTTCGCVQGSCSWRETPEYINCLNQLNQSG